MNRCLNQLTCAVFFIYPFSVTSLSHDQEEHKRVTSTVAGNWRHVASQLVDWLGEELGRVDREVAPEGSGLLPGMLLLLRQVLAALRIYDDDPLWATVQDLEDAISAADRQRQRCELESLDFLLRNL